MAAAIWAISRTENGKPETVKSLSDAEKPLSRAGDFSGRFITAAGLVSGHSRRLLGRNRIATRPSALPGFYFWLPIIGEIVFDGRRLRRGTPYPQPDQQMVCRFRDLMGKDLVVYQRFTAYSDSNAFQAAGLPTVSLSSDNMYYLDVVWERDVDRVEWLDERNLELARQLIVRYANAQI